MPTTGSISADISTTNISSAQSRARAGRAWYGTLRAVSSACCRRRTKLSMTKANTAGRSSTRPTTAPIEKFCWPMTCL